ncbi:MAG: type I-A CRISPR-associated protein Cas4/Csa1 [Crenarchaeota archaeon]|nr:type I-A CRISPR-associated protein Cas4/Csa1 [Thermoproteota archaeon]
MEEFSELEKACDVSSELRGWSWCEPPVLFVGCSRLSVSDIVSFCSTGRDVFLRYVVGVRGKFSKCVVRGLVVHVAFREFIHSLKRILYSGNVRNGVELLEALKREGHVVFSRVFDDPIYSTIDAREVEALFWEVWRRGMTIYSGAFDKYLRNMDVDLRYIDSIVKMVVPLDVEFRIDGSKIGLSNVRIDALLFPYVPVEIKVGEGVRPELALAGYALVLESVLRRPINHGVIVNVDVRSDLSLSWRVKTIHIGEDLRLEFLHERDRRADIVDKKVDPGLASSCPVICPYYEYCHGKTSEYRSTLREKKAQDKPSRKIKVKIVKR